MAGQQVENKLVETVHTKHYLSVNRPPMQATRGKRLKHSDQKQQTLKGSHPPKRKRALIFSFSHGQVEDAEAFDLASGADGD